LTRTALIVGAGIGGLTAGLALRQAGWNIRIFERAAAPRELGFELGLVPNAIAALRELGVADVVLARSVEPRRGELRRIDGTVLKRTELPPEALGGQIYTRFRGSCALLRVCVQTNSTRPAGWTPRFANGTVNARSVRSL
jgi:2-polyprenyl-6-methoxyphenol hydroxylase-like FAD-dependent oxidoreductase